MSVFFYEQNDNSNNTKNQKHWNYTKIFCFFYLIEKTLWFSQRKKHLNNKYVFFYFCWTKKNSEKAKGNSHSDFIQFFSINKTIIRVLKKIHGTTNSEGTKCVSNVFDSKTNGAIGKWKLSFKATTNILKQSERVLKIGSFHQ